MMKNNLLGTAAILLALGVSVPLVGSASAECAKTDPGGVAPALKITGNATATYHWFENGDRARVTPGAREFGLGTLFAIEDSRLDFRATGRMETGWTDQTFYDWLIGFTGDTGETKEVEENRIRLKGRWGTIMFGNTQGVENFMARGAFSIPGGTGGFDGNFKTTTPRPTGLLLTTDMVGATKYASKFTFVTPRFYGFQAGFSYTPNSEHKGEGTNGPPRNRTSSKSPQEAFNLNLVAFGLNYVNKITDDFAVALSATAVTGKTKPPTGNNQLDNTNLYTAFQTAPRHRTNSYALGAVASYKCFDLGVEWINNGRSQQIRNAPNALAAGAARGTPNGRAPVLVNNNPNARVTANGVNQNAVTSTQYNGPLGAFNAGTAFSVAGAYSFGANKVSVGYYRSKRLFNGANTIANVYSLDYDRAIAPGFSVFAEGVIYDLKSRATSVAFQNNLAANFATCPGGAACTPGNGPSSSLQGNNGKTLLLGALTKF
jgi:hypothetical protein